MSKLINGSVKQNLNNGIKEKLLQENLQMTKQLSYYLLGEYGKTIGRLRAVMNKGINNEIENQIKKVTTESDLNTLIVPISIHYNTRTLEVATRILNKDRSQKSQTLNNIHSDFISCCNKLNESQDVPEGEYYYSPGLFVSKLDDNFIEPKVLNAYKIQPFIELNDIFVYQLSTIIQSFEKRKSLINKQRQLLEKEGEELPDYEQSVSSENEGQLNQQKLQQRLEEIKEEIWVINEKVKEDLDILEEFLEAQGEKTYKGFKAIPTKKHSVTKLNKYLKENDPYVSTKKNESGIYLSNHINYNKLKQYAETLLEISKHDILTNSMSVKEDGYNIVMDKGSSTRGMLQQKESGIHFSQIPDRTERRAAMVTLAKAHMRRNPTEKDQREALGIWKQEKKYTTGVSRKPIRKKKSVKKVVKDILPGTLNVMVDDSVSMGHSYPLVIHLVEELKHLCMGQKRVLRVGLQGSQETYDITNKNGRTNQIKLGELYLALAEGCTYTKDYNYIQQKMMKLDCEDDSIGSDLIIIGDLLDKSPNKSLEKEFMDFYKKNKVRVHVILATKHSGKIRWHHNLHTTPDWDSVIIDDENPTTFNKIEQEKGNQLYSQLNAIFLTNDNKANFEDSKYKAFLKNLAKLETKSQYNQNIVQRSSNNEKKNQRLNS